MNSRRLERMLPTAALLCTLAVVALASPDGQYERVANNRYCNGAGDCYTKEQLPSGVVRFCRDGGGCRYLSAPQTVACPQGYALANSGACQTLQQPPPRQQQRSPQASGTDYRRRQNQQRSSRY